MRSILRLRSFSGFCLRVGLAVRLTLARCLRGAFRLSPSSPRRSYRFGVTRIQKVLRSLQEIAQSHKRTLL